MNNRISTIGDLIHDRSNPRKHNPRNIKVIVDSLHDVGFARSIVIDEDNNILAGNGVTEAAVLAGIEKVIEIEADGNTIIAVRRRGLTDEQKQRLKYFDNRSGELADWDTEQLLADIGAGLDLSSMFRADELDALLAELTQPPEQVEDAGAQVDRAAELQSKWQVKPGDIWQIDSHFVICGDCRQPETWRRLLNAAGVDKVNGVFTSPPYAEQRKEQYGGVPTAEYVDWWEAVQANVKANLASDGSFFVNIKPHCEDGQRVLYVCDLVCAMVRRWGWRWHDELYWQKNATPHDIKDVRRFYDAIESVYQFSVTHRIKFEPAHTRIERDEDARQSIVRENKSRKTRAAAGDSRPKYSATGSGYHASVTQMDVNYRYADNVIWAATASDGYHAAAFPVALPDFFIRAYSDPGDVWCDPFLGSGTSIVAAHQNGRRGLGIERMEKYCAVILERLQTATGKTPVLV